LCVSAQSALSYEAIGGKVLDIGAGYGDNLLEKITKYPKDAKWLYLRAKVTASDFVSKCHELGYSIDETVMYESGCSKEIEKVSIEEDSILIFTSPSSVKCFLKNHTINKDSTVIVIGKTTAASLPKNIKYILSNETTIESCIDIAKKN
jgi:uroporphyrinogen-III synthase